MKAKLLSLTVLAVAGALITGCQQQDVASKKKPGSYAAARQNRVGSNIPQPYSADSVGASIDPDQYNKMGNQLTNGR